MALVYAALATFAADHIRSARSAGCCLGAFTFMAADITGHAGAASIALATYAIKTAAAMAFNIFAASLAIF